MDEHSRWYSFAGDWKLERPPPHPATVASSLRLGDLFLYKNLSSETFDVWMWSPTEVSDVFDWVMSDTPQVPCPLEKCRGYVLNIGENVIPKWVQPATIKRRVH
jgi:hypothetical protein